MLNLILWPTDFWHTSLLLMNTFWKISTLTNISTFLIIYNFGTKRLKLPKNNGKTRFIERLIIYSNYTSNFSLKSNFSNPQLVISLKRDAPPPRERGHKNVDYRVNLGVEFKYDSRFQIKYDFKGFSIIFMIFLVWKKDARREIMRGKF